MLILCGQGHIQEIPNISRPGQAEKKMSVIRLMLASGAVGLGSHLTKNVYQFGTRFENAYIYTV